MTGRHLKKMPGTDKNSALLLMYLNSTNFMRIILNSCFPKGIVLFSTWYFEGALTLFLHQSDEVKVIFLSEVLNLEY